MTVYGNESPYEWLAAKTTPGSPTEDSAMLESIRSVLICRDNMSPEDADALIEEARTEIEAIIDDGGSLDDLEELVKDYFGLEPDYLIELLP